MNTWKTANAVVQCLEDGRRFIVDAPLEGDVRITPCVRPYEGGQRLLEDLETELTDAGFDVRQVACHRTLAVELRVRDDVGGWAW